MARTKATWKAVLWTVGIRRHKETHFVVCPRLTISYPQSEHGRIVILPLSPEEARNFAADLLKYADRADEEMKKDLTERWNHVD